MMNNIIPKHGRDIIRNFFRDNLLSLIGKTNERPILVTGIYRHNIQYYKWYSFVDIRPYLGKDINTYRLCNHLNVMLTKTDVVLDEKDDGKRFFITGFPSSYSYYGTKRGSLKLLRGRRVPEIFGEEELDQFEATALRQCFLLENYRVREIPT